MLTRPFISLWIGDHFLIENVCFVLLVVDFFIHSMYQPAYVMYGAVGKFRDDKFITVASAVINIVVSIMLVVLIGLPGVIIGTLLTDVYIWVIRSYQMVKGYWGKDIMVYSLRMTFYSCLTLVEVILLLKIGDSIRVDDLFAELMIKAVICCIVPNLVNILATCKSGEFRLLISYLKSYLHRRER